MSKCSGCDKEAWICVACSVTLGNKEYADRKKTLETMNKQLKEALKGIVESSASGYYTDDYYNALAIAKKALEGK